MRWQELLTSLVLQMESRLEPHTLPGKAFQGRTPVEMWEPGEQGIADFLAQLPAATHHTTPSILGLFSTCPALSHPKCLGPALHPLSTALSCGSWGLTQHSPYILASAHRVPMLAEVLVGLPMDWQVVQVLK